MRKRMNSEDIETKDSTSRGGGLNKRILNVSMGNREYTMWAPSPVLGFFIDVQCTMILMENDEEKEGWHKAYG